MKLCCRKLYLLIVKQKTGLVHLKLLFLCLKNMLITHQSCENHPTDYELTVQGFRILCRDFTCEASKTTFPKLGILYSPGVEIDRL